MKKTWKKLQCTFLRERSQSKKRLHTIGFHLLDILKKAKLRRK